ncbi:MAG: hypothetical protein HQL53_09760 [Magnetococcales bacterium]|nr:hypothetical protein [Magnetococcales bacterium]
MISSNWNPERRTFLRHMAALGLLAPTAALLTACVKARPFSTGFQSLHGAVRINGRNAQRGVWKGPGSLVETGPGATTTLSVGENAFMLRPNSRVEFLGGPPASTTSTKLETAAKRQHATEPLLITNSDSNTQSFNAEAPSTVKNDTLAGLLIHQGGVLSVIQSGQSPIFRTPEARFGIRGTGLYIEAEPNHTYLCTCYGTVIIQSVDDPNLKETVNTRHHEAPREIFRNQEGTARIARTAMRDHTDAELILLESLVGRRPPFFEDEANNLY